MLRSRNISTPLGGLLAVGLMVLGAACGYEGGAGDVATGDAQKEVAMDEPARQGDYIRVDVRGTLEHGLMAIGGETTGTTISAGNVTWELDLRGNARWQRLAEELDGRKARVQGTLEKRQGVEIGERWIVTVESLAASE